MIENLCEYALPITFITGKVVTCKVDKCLRNYRIEVHLDGEPKYLCLVDGKLPGIEPEKNNLIRKVPPIISIREALYN